MMKRKPFAVASVQADGAEISVPVIRDAENFGSRGGNFLIIVLNLHAQADITVENLAKFVDREGKFVIRKIFLEIFFNFFDFMFVF